MSAPRLSRGRNDVVPKTLDLSLLIYFCSLASLKNLGGVFEPCNHIVVDDFEFVGMDELSTEQLKTTILLGSECLLNGYLIR